jgi:hypothetical protein
MINRSLAIGIGILILVGLGFLFMSTMTGNVITGSVASEKVMEEEYFKISDFGAGKSGEVEDGASDSSRSE